MRDKYQWGRGFSDYTILLTKNSRDAQANPTLASGDVQVSKDGGAFSNLDSLPTVSPASGVQVKVTLSDVECSAKSIMVRFKDAAGDEWEEQTLLLSAMDSREGLVGLKVPAAFGERAGITSANITRSGYPSMGVLYTDSSSPLATDFDTRQLLGSLIHNEDEGTGFVVLGGYFFDDSDDTTDSVFGICKDPDSFGMTNGGTVTPYEPDDPTWAGAADEAGSGDGWTFIVQYTDQTYPMSNEDLFIYFKPGFVLEAAMNDMLDLRRLWVENDAGTAIFAKSTGNGGTGIAAYGNGSGAGIACMGEAGQVAMGFSARGHHGIQTIAQSVTGVGAGFSAVGANNGPGAIFEGHGTGKDISAKEIDDILVDTADMQPKLGTIQDLTSGATIGLNFRDVYDVAASLTNPVNDTKDIVDWILADTADMQPKLGTIQDLGSGDTIGDNLADIDTLSGAVEADIAAVQATVDAIEIDTQDLQVQIGTAGAGLTDLGGMSSGMIDEVKAAYLASVSDGKTQEEINEILLSMAQGKFVKTGDNIVFYLQDSTTPLWEITVSDTSRTRL